MTPPNSRPAAAAAAPEDPKKDPAITTPDPPTPDTSNGDTSTPSDPPTGNDGSTPSEDTGVIADDAVSQNGPELQAVVDAAPWHTYTKKPHAIRARKPVPGEFVHGDRVPEGCLVVDDDGMIRVVPESTITNLFSMVVPQEVAGKFSFQVNDPTMVPKEFRNEHDQPDPVKMAYYAEAQAAAGQKIVIPGVGVSLRVG